MELRAGYKRTEVGVIPDCWATSSLGELGTWKGGATPSMSNPQFWLNGEVPWASSGEVKSTLLSDTTLKITEAAVKQSSTTLLPTNSVMMVTRSGILRKYLPVAKNTRPIAINQDIKAVIPGAKVDADFLLHALVDSGPRILASCLKAGTTVESVEYPWLKAFKIPLPLVPEQRAIASALSDVDALVAKIDQFIAKKRDLKQAAMQQLLTGQTRLPGFSGEWEVKPMKSLGQTYGGLAGKTKEDFGHGSSKYIPFMNVMTDTVIDPNWLETVDIAQNEAQNLAKKGDLFFNGSSETPEEVGFCSVLLEDIPNLYLNSFCFGFRFNTDAKVSGLFFAYWFRGADGRAAMSVLAQGATRYNIAKSAFMRLSIPQPSQEEQTAIARVLTDMDIELAALEARRDKTRALKQGMMQALLTGRIRLGGAN